MPVNIHRLHTLPKSIIEKSKLTFYKLQLTITVDHWHYNISTSSFPPSFNMCFGVTCSTCSKATWRGCGQHIPSALSGVPEDQWCTCTPKVTVNGKEYPPAGSVSIPGMSWLSSLFGGGSSNDKAKQESKRRGEL
ncbi:unnamed protein product [Colletotrichum noveboracense]|uniref:Uncharacterized protein n=1 Tax=Colletotrichum noveboracense TaxID=2664923 RepID=A0A9W4WHB2_9PEZI|nr:uncharacterized protein CGMCC3_g16220 [Colletotrichum fructicola]KAE9567659.1 hypothetical protein CGMCC3_g16220 [Colletotrichum fructicola]CAI0644956.1 unnamed protein product [Colletotrichum noveboracense]